MFPSTCGAFIDELVRTRGLAREAVVAEVVDIVRAAAVGLLGTATPLAIALVGPLAEIRVAQVLTVVEEVSDPARELARADARLLVDDVAVGEVLEVAIDYTHDPREAERRAALAAVADRLPLPLWAAGLWDALGAALNAHWLRRFPAPAVAEDSLWALLAGGGGWLIGQEARAGATTLRVAGAWLTFIRLDPHRGWVDAGIDVEVARGAERERWRLRRSDNDGLARHTLGVPAGQDAAAVVAALTSLAAAIEAGGTGSLSEYAACEQLLAAAIRPPQPGSSWAWCEAELPRLLGGHRHEFTAAGRALALEIVDVFPPDRGLRGFGGAGVALQLADVGSGEAARAYVSLGALERDALVAAGPDAATAAALAAMAATWLAWLDVHVVHHLSEGPFEIADDFLYAMAGHFPLVELLAARLRDGPPPPVPVPPFDAQALARAASRLRPAGRATQVRAREAVGAERLLAAFEVGPYAIVFADDLRRAWPFADAFIGLLAPGVEGICEVLRVDAWNHPSRAVVDGDAFALRRLCEWLRAALVAGGLDLEIVYTGEDDADDADEEDEEDDGAELAGPVRLMLSAWLRFGLPDVGDRFLVDWRHQWHIAFAGSGIVACFGGIYGMDGEQRARIDERDRRVWRSFLCEQIDPRFGAARPG